MRPFHLISLALACSACGATFYTATDDLEDGGGLAGAPGAASSSSAGAGPFEPEPSRNLGGATSELPTGPETGGTGGTLPEDPPEPEPCEAPFWASWHWEEHGAHARACVDGQCWAYECISPHRPNCQTIHPHDPTGGDVWAARVRC